MTLKTFEQYESVHGLLELLKNIINPALVRDARQDFIYQHADAWTLCDDCAELVSDCICDDYSDRYSREYDDEASFE